MSAPRFEIARTDAGWHARFIAANGKTVWVTESYRRRKAAVNAIEVILGQQVIISPFSEHPEIYRGPWPSTTEVRDVDAREATP